MNKLSEMGTALLLALFGVASASPVNAEEHTLACGGKITNIYFGNGVLVTRLDAEGALDELKSAYESRLEALADDPEARFIFGLAYNPTQDETEDLAEVYRQLNPAPGAENMTSGQLIALSRLRLTEIRKLAKRIRMLESSGNISRLQPLYQILGINGGKDAVALEQAKKAGDALLQKLLIGFSETSQTSTNEEHAQLYRNNLLAGQRVIVVAHSQGNLFANHNVQTVIDENSEWANSIGVVAVATPATETVNRGKYVTAHDDLVIAGLRAVPGSGVLASNIENDLFSIPFTDFRDSTGHYFIPSYLDGRLPSRAVIDDLLYGFASSLTYPESEVGDGAIRATLQWGSELDVDLHVYEPDNVHVYYSNTVGEAGELDRDDTSSFGPENYFVACDKLKAGTYQFGVNYFSGENPENARLQLTTADGQVLSTSRFLSEAVGSGGNDSPQILITLEVSIDSEGKVTYTPSAS